MLRRGEKHAVAADNSGVCRGSTACGVSSDSAPSDSAFAKRTQINLSVFCVDVSEIEEFMTQMSIITNGFVFRRNEVIHHKDTKGRKICTRADEKSVHNCKIASP